MPAIDRKVDAYIDKAPDYARPILTRVRAWVHEGAPNCEEALKWGNPAFLQNGILCGMAAFKEYCVVGFWKSSLIFGDAPSEGGMAGPIGRIHTVKELPPKKEFIGYIKRAVELNLSGVKVARPPAKPMKALVMPDEFRRAIDKKAKARKAFEAFSPSHQREYIEWITEAKQEATRARRIAQAIEWMSEGKARNWKYQK
jgi:uncharacterized protein YdeI (YjbR/CyaY-like superfamily)